MQDLGYIILKDGTKVYLLRRSSKYGFFLKLRASQKSQKPGQHFSDEQIYLEECSDKLQQLLGGETIFA